MLVREGIMTGVKTIRGSYTELYPALACRAVRSGCEIVAGGRRHRIHDPKMTSQLEWVQDLCAVSEMRITPITSGVFALLDLREIDAAGASSAIEATARVHKRRPSPQSAGSSSAPHPASARFISQVRLNNPAPFLRWHCSYCTSER